MKKRRIPDFGGTISLLTPAQVSGASPMGGVGNLNLPAGNLGIGLVSGMLLYTAPVAASFLQKEDSASYVQQEDSSSKIQLGY